MLQASHQSGLSFPLPTRVMSNGEFDAPPRTALQRRAQIAMLDLARRYGKPLGLDPRGYFRTDSGLAAGFLAMNMVYGEHFAAGADEAADPEAARERSGGLAGQFILDDQTHYAHDGYKRKDVLLMREYAKWKLNPALRGEERSQERVFFRNYFREMFLESTTSVALLTSATADDPRDWFLSNDQMALGRDAINDLLGARRMLCHSLIAPRHPGWLDEIDRCAEMLRPASWKSYPVGDPFHYSKWPYRLDDEELMYPAYAKLMRHGIRTLCVHKGLMPANFLKHFANWKYGNVEDLPKAAKDWPDITFVIYHAAFRPSLMVPGDFLRDFERTGRMEWVTDLAEIPAKHGVSNIYADLGTTFAATAVSHPRLAAAILGILVKGLGEDRVLWGTDAVWYGSPRWQIEALRRIEIPEDMQRKHGFAPLGGPDSPVKRKILGLNAARLYGINPQDYAADDRLAALHREYCAAGERGDEVLDSILGPEPRKRRKAARRPSGEGRRPSA